MHQICNWTKYHKLAFYILIFEQMKIQTFSAPWNDRLNLIIVKDINISVHIFIGSKITTWNSNLWYLAQLQFWCLTLYSNFQIWVHVLHKGLLMQDWVFRLGIMEVFDECQGFCFSRHNWSCYALTRTLQFRVWFELLQRKWAIQCWHWKVWL